MLWTDAQIKCGCDKYETSHWNSESSITFLMSTLRKMGMSYTAKKFAKALSLEEKEARAVLRSLKVRMKSFRQRAKAVANRTGKESR